MVRSILTLVLMAFATTAGIDAFAAPSKQLTRARKKVVFIAGRKSHGPGDHEYELGCRLLAKSIETSPNLRGWRTEVHLDGWPLNEETLNDADSIVVYCDGSDHNEADHPLLTGDRLQTLGRQMRRGCGLVLLHYATFAPVKRGGPEYLDWVGGFFDYETGTAANHWYSKIQVVDTSPSFPAPKHPILRGVEPFTLKDEFYYDMKMRPSDPRRTAILNVSFPGEHEAKTVAWAVQRRDGGRGFAFTGGHAHSNWKNEALRTLILNAIAWTARSEVPAAGIRSKLAADPDNPGVP